MNEKSQMRFGFRKLANDPNMFEFTIATPLLRAQFRLPKAVVNKLRVDLERAITDPGNKPRKPE